MKTIAVVLAGGVGKRFWPLATSKPLFPFFRKPIITYTLQSLKKAGFTQVVIVVNKKDKKELVKIKIPRLKIQFVVQDQPKGMADALLSTESILKNESIFIVNAQDLVESSLFDNAYKNFGKHKAFIVAKEQKEYFDAGYILAANGRLVKIIEKPGTGKQPSKLINLVFHYFSSSRELLGLLKNTKSNKDDVYEKTITSYAKKEKVSVLTYKGYWQTLKYPWHVLDMTKVFLENKLETKNNSLSISKSAHIDKNVYIGKGVKVLGNAVIKGPTWIGDHTIIGTNTLILESMIGPNCVIGFASEVSRSYLGKNCWLHKNYIGDSVLESNNYFGAGAVTANFKFDAGDIKSMVRGNLVNSKRVKFGTIVADKAKVGVNASLMPGIKIGTNSIVGPGVVQFDDVKSKHMILKKNNYYNTDL